MSTTLAAPPACDPQVTATRLERSAGIIQTNDRFIGNLWEFAHRIAWQPTMPVCAAGSIAIALGQTTHAAVANGALRGCYIDAGTFADCDEAVQALARHIGADTFNALFAWSDGHEAGAIARVMRACAAELRLAVSA